MATRIADPQLRLRAALVGRYEIRGELGRGATSHVYLARDLRHQRDVALKVLREELALTIGADRFRREIEQWAPLVHPNILPLLDSGDADGLLYFTTPAVAGETLRARLEREVQLPVADALSIAVDIADALAHAHEAGLVHRDVKPDNILLSGERALLGDFGYARARAFDGAERITGAGFAVGTPLYSSPEQASGAVDARGDQYSLGCVVYEMLAGQPPFHGPTSQAIIARHLLDAPSSLSKLRPAVPPDVERIVARMLAKVPADRYPTTRAMLAELRAALEAVHLSERGTPTPASLNAFVPVPVPAPVRRRARVAAIAAGALIAVASAALWWRATHAGRPRGEPAFDARQIAVLPFEDQSSDGSMRWLAAGLTADLIESLRGVPALSVRSPAAVRAFRGSSAPLDSIARTLRVGTVITGTVGGARGMMRVDVLLTDAATGDAIGPAVRVSLTADALDSARTAVVEGVAAQLRRTLGKYVTDVRRRREAGSALAWELLQRGDEARLDAVQRLERGDTASARQLLVSADSTLRHAERASPRWSEPTVLRGWVAGSMADLTAERTAAACDSACQGWRRAAIAHAERALAYDPSDDGALELHGIQESLLAPLSEPAVARRLYAHAERDLVQATERNPWRARAWLALAQLYLQQGELARTAAATRQAVKADAFLDDARRALVNLFYDALYRDDFDEANRLCAAGLAEYPGYLSFAECRLTVIGWSAATRAGIDSAWAALRDADARASRIFPDPDSAYRRAAVAAVIARAGLADSARAVVRATERQHPRPPQGWYFQRAWVHLIAGDTAAALADLRQHLQLVPTDRAYVATWPWFRPLRLNPDFRSLVEPPHR